MVPVEVTPQRLAPVLRPKAIDDHFVADGL